MITTAFWFAAAIWWFQRDAGSSRLPPPQPSSSMLMEMPEPRGSSSAAPEKGPALVVPVIGVGRDQLVDTFTQARANGARSHDAIDILAPRGTPVIAAAAGKVEKLFLSKAGGNTVYIRSPDGRRLYYYAHLESYAPGLGEGMAVREGTPIGTVGSSGNADPASPHLHFAVWATSPDRKWWENAAAMNPYPLLKP